LKKAKTSQECFPTVNEDSDEDKELIPGDIETSVEQLEDKVEDKPAKPENLKLDREIFTMEMDSDKDESIKPQAVTVKPKMKKQKADKNEINAVKYGRNTEEEKSEKLKEKKKDDKKEVKKVKKAEKETAGKSDVCKDMAEKAEVETNCKKEKNTVIKKQVDKTKVESNTKKEKRKKDSKKEATQQESEITVESSVISETDTNHKKEKGADGDKIQAKSTTTVNSKTQENEKSEETVEIKENDVEYEDEVAEGKEDDFENVTKDENEMDLFDEDKEAEDTVPEPDNELQSAQKQSQDNSHTLEDSDNEFSLSEHTMYEDPILQKVRERALAAPAGDNLSGEESDPFDLMEE